MNPFATVETNHMLVAMGILALSGALAWLSRYLMKWLASRARLTATTLDDMVLGAVAWPLFSGVALGGIYAALAYLPLRANINELVGQGVLVALAAIGVFAALSIIDALLRWYGREVAATTRTELDDKLIPVLRVGVPITGAALGLLAILGMLGIEHPGINAWLSQHGARVLLIVVLGLLGFFAVSRGLPKVVKSTVRRGMIGEPEGEVVKRSDTLATVLVTTAQVVIISAAVMMLLSEFVDIAPILAGVGVAGIAIGFGAQSLVKDVLTGLFIIMECQYHVGDVVRVAGISGLVEDINLRRTVLRDLDGIVHFVPNGEIRVASNFTKEFSRVNMNISVSYGTNLDKAIAVINRVGREMAEDAKWSELILKAPQVLRVDKLGDSGIDIKVVGDTKPIKQWDVMGELRKRVKEAFDAEGIEIPYPHVKVYFGGSPLNVSADGPGAPRSPIPEGGDAGK